MALLFASAVFSFPGCTEEEGPAAPDPIITITTDSPVTAEAAGGSDYYFEYTVENEVEGATVTCDVTYNGTETEWISIDDEQASAGKITFGIGYYENTEAGRTAVITVIYTYGDGKTVSDEIEVSQTQAEAAPEPVLSTVSQETAKAAAAENATIDVEIYNPVEGATVTVSTDGFADPAIDPEDPWLTAEWVEGESYTSDSGTPILSGTIKYSVTANETSDERTAHITLTYKYGENEEDVKESVIDFTQEAGGLEFVFVREMSTEVITSYTAPAEGGTCGVQYKTSGNQSYDNDAVTFSVDYSGDSQNWITINDNDMVGYLSFNTTANTTGEARSAVITLNYENDGLTASASITINQEPKVGGAEPEITVSEKTINTIAKPGEYDSYSINAVIEPVIEGGVLSAKADVNWIKINYFNGTPSETSNSVYLTFNVNENTGAESREGTITLTYTYTDGTEKTVTETVKVIQAKGEGSTVNHEFIFESSLNNTIPANDTDTYQFNFMISGVGPDDLDYSAYEVESTADWLIIYDYDFNYDELYFSYRCDENTSTESRTADIVFSYTCSDNTVLTQKYTVTQEGKKEVSGGGEINFEPTSALIQEYGTGNYALYLMVTSESYLNFDIFTSGGNVTAGSYTFSKDNSPNTFSQWSTFGYVNLNGGSFNVNSISDNEISISGTVTSEDGSTINFSYAGTLDVY